MPPAAFGRPSLARCLVLEPLLFQCRQTAVVLDALQGIVHCAFERRVVLLEWNHPCVGAIGLADIQLPIECLFGIELIEGYGAAGVWVNASDRAEILDNDVLPGSGPAIQIIGSTGHVVRRNTLGGAGVSEPGTGTVENNF